MERLDWAKIAIVFAFYSVITYALFPYLYYTWWEPTLNGFGKGFIIGSALSVMLWHFFGRRYVRV